MYLYASEGWANSLGALRKPFQQQQCNRDCHPVRNVIWHSGKSHMWGLPLWEEQIPQKSSGFTSQTTHSTSRGLSVWVSSPFSELSSGKNTWELREQTQERGFHGSLLCSTIWQQNFFSSGRCQFWWGSSLRQAKKWLQDCVLHSASLLCCKHLMSLCKCLSVQCNCSADAEGECPWRQTSAHCLLPFKTSRLCLSDACSSVYPVHSQIQNELRCPLW